MKADKLSPGLVKVTAAQRGEKLTPVLAESLRIDVAHAELSNRTEFR